MINASKKIIVLAGLLLIIFSAIPLSASAQTTQFQNDIFSKTWWVTQPAKFVNDIFNPIWWKTQPSKFVNDIFNSFWPAKARTKFINDIFNPTWWTTQPAKFVNDIFNSKWVTDLKSKFMNDIFRQVSLDSVINTITSSFGLSDQSAPAQPSQPSGSSPSSSGTDCWALYNTTCYAKCSGDIDCLKVCSQKFAQCMKDN